MSRDLIKEYNKKTREAIMTDKEAIMVDIEESLHELLSKYVGMQPNYMTIASIEHQIKKMFGDDVNKCAITSNPNGTLNVDLQFTSTLNTIYMGVDISEYE